MTPVEIARSRIGVPWMHQARGPDFLDCIGLLVDCFRDFGIHDRSDYDKDPRAGKLEKCIREQFGPPVPKELMMPGDVVLMSFPKVVRHIGIIDIHSKWKGELSIIHTWSGGPRKVCETRMDEDWFRRIKLVHRWGAQL